MCVVAAGFRSAEGRVHQDDTGADRRLQQVVDELGVMAGRWSIEQLGEDARALWIDLVQVKRRIGGDKPGREHPGACRRLKHGIARGDVSGCCRQARDRHWGRKLLTCDLLLGAVALGRDVREDLLDALKLHGCGAEGAVTRERRHHQDLSAFQSVVGVAHRPGSGRVGGAE